MLLLGKELQIVAWLLTLLEVSAAFYILVLNPRHKANRHVTFLLLLYAVNGFAIGQLLGAVDVEAAQMPTLHLAAAAPAVGPSLLLTALILVKPAWVSGSHRWARWALYALIGLPALLVALDFSLGTQLLYSGIDPWTYGGGFIATTEYLNGQFGLLIRSLYMYGLHVVPPLLLLYLVVMDQDMPTRRRRLTRFLLGLHGCIIVVMFGISRSISMPACILFGQVATAIVYTYAAFRQMISKREVRRGNLQNRLMALLLVVTVPIVAGIVLFIVGEVETLFSQVLQGADLSHEELALMLERFKRTVWLLAGGSLFLGLGLVWLTIRQALRPIRALTETARAIANGDLERRAPVESVDEVGTLAHAFNVMTAQLRSLIDVLEDRVAERTQALETALKETQALYRVSDALITSSELDAVLQAVVDNVAETFSASGVLLITVDREAEEVIDFVSSQDKNVAVVPTPYAELMEGLTGWVLRTSQPALSPKGDRDPRESTLITKRRHDNRVGSLIVVPLCYRGETFGTLTALNRVDDPDFTERDVNLMAALAGQAAAVVQNARLMKQTQASLKETRALYRLSRSLIKPQRENELLQRTVDLVAETLPADRVGIATIDFERQRILSSVVGGAGVDKIDTNVTFEEMMEGLSGWAIREREPAISAKDHTDPRESSRVQKRRADTDCGAILVVPLYYQDKVLGTMTAINRSDQPNFTEHDAELMMAMANQAAAAIQNVYFFEQLQRSLAETHALYNISQRLITSDSLQSLLQAVVDGVVKTLPANRAALITLDQEQKQVLDFVGRGPGLQHMARISYGELMEGLSGWVLRENRPALSPKGEPDPRESPRVRQRRAETASGSILVVPLHYQGKTQGTITAINRPEAPDFTQHDVDLMMTLANQASAAIKNTQLFQQTQAALARTEVLYQVARSLIAYEDLRDLLHTVSAAIADMLGASRVVSITFDVGEGAVQETVGVGFEERDSCMLEFDELEEGLIGWVIREQSPALSSGRAPDPRESADVQERRAEFGIGPVIVTPLKHQDRMLGAITALRHKGEDDFTQQDVDLMMAVTNQAAAAVQNARLFDQTQQALRETQALYRASQPLFTYKDLPSLLHSIVAGIAEALPASRVMLVNLDREARTVVDIVVGGENDEKIPVTFEELWDGLTGWVLRNEQPAFSSKNACDVRERPYIREGRERYGFGSIIVVPLRYREKIFGTITALNREDEPDFTQRDVDLMAAMANQAAAAIENARLFEQTQAALNRTRALYDVSRSLIDFDDPSEALIKTTNAVAEVLDADRVVLYTLDMEAGRIIHQIKSGPDPIPLSPISFDELMQGLTGWVLSEGKATLSPKDVADPRESLRVQARRAELNSGSIIVAPLRYGTKVLGTISAINRLDQRDFKGEDVETLAAMANQIAAAVDNARLFKQTQQALAKTEALYRVARSVITLESLGDKLQSVTRQVALGLSADRVLLITLDLEKKRILRHVTSGAGQKIPRVSFEQLMEGLTGWVVRERKPAISPKGEPDPREGPSARHIRAISASGSILVVPLIYQQEVLGTLTAINRFDQRDFTSEDADLMLTMANQAATAIKNAQLVEGLEAEVAAQTAEIRAQQEKTEAILQSVGDAITMSTPSLRIQYVNRAFLNLTGYQPEEIMGRRVPLLLKDGMQGLQRIWPSIRHDLGRGKIWHGEAVVRRKDGRTYDAAITIAEMRNVQDEVTGYVTSHRNITKRKQLEKVRRDFLVNVSHQLRTPVTTVQLYLQLLQQDPGPAKTARYLRNADQEISSLAHLVEDMLTVTELDSGDALTVWTEVSMVDIAQDIVTHYLPQVKEKQIALELEIVNAPLPTVYGDPKKLHKAVAELVENAVNFTPPRGHITLELRLIDDDEQRWVQLVVEDDGPGIVPGEREYLFERFYRGRLAESGNIPGSGLGLVIAKAIVEAHAGELRLLNCDGEGSKFAIRLLVNKPIDRGNASIWWP